MGSALFAQCWARPESPVLHRHGAFPLADGRATPARWRRKQRPGSHQKCCAASVAVYALAPIVGLHTRRPAIGRAKAVPISHECIRGFRPKGIGIPSCFARERFVVSGEVFARGGGICHRRDNQNRAKQAKDRGSHYGGENRTSHCSLHQSRQSRLVGRGERQSRHARRSPRFSELGPPNVIASYTSGGSASPFGGG
jgi:hypothetical protein